MWRGVKNQEIVAMLALLCGVAILVLILATRGGTISIVEAEFAETDDISESADIFSTNTLPSDERFMASIGNGHLATNIFSDTIFMNGLYNGERGNSKRARIPSWANIRLNSTLGTHHIPVYSLDTKQGVFHVHIEKERTAIEHRIYAHRYYTRAIVNQIIITSKIHEPDFAHQVVWIDVKQDPGLESTDIIFEDVQSELMQGREVLSKCGKTKVSEDINYQPNPSEVCLFWTKVPEHIVAPKHGTKVYTYVMTADQKREVAKKEINAVLQESSEELYRKHTLAWSKLRDQCKINIEGNIEVAKIVNGIWYYYLSSLPSDTSYQPQNMFYGLSPSGLARGGTADDYEGHNFWDTEIWMFPSILLFYPKLAEKLLNYRIEKAPAAADLAKLTGYRGIRYPWESAFTGNEVTQPCCPEISTYEQHITACIAFAMRQYLAVTRDQKWLRKSGCSVVTDMAEFWASKANLNFKTGYYDISNVMGPDEDHKNVTNSAFTNVVAGYSLYLAQYVACLCKSFFSTENPDRWADIAWSLALPYDEMLDYHPEYDGYRRSTPIKQADVVLLGYPLQYQMKPSTRMNDLNYYESVTRESGPAMTWSMHTIGHLQLNNNQRAEQLFNKSYTPYVREPFKVWAELKRPDVGAVNFLTGMGGFLQTLLFGYGGISINLDKLVIRKPQLPPKVTRFEIIGIKYLGSNITLNIHSKKTILMVNSMDPQWPLMMRINNYNITLKVGEKVTLSGEGPFNVLPTKLEDCPLPADRIGNNYFRPIGA